MSSQSGNHHGDGRISSATGISGINPESMPWREKFLDTLTAGLMSMFKSGLHTDTTVVVEEKTFHCHKVILSAMSPYFEAMFFHDMKETRDGIVTLQDIDADIFECMLRFLYAGEDVVCEDNAEKLFRAASVMQVPSLLERCEEFLLSQVSYENCIGIWKIAKTHHCVNLAEKAFTTILENFHFISTSDEFLSLEEEDLVCIMRDDNLTILDEEFACDAVFQWIAADPEVREKNLDKIVKILRLPLTSADYLFQALEENSIIRKCKQFRDVLQEALKYHTCPAKRQEFTTLRTTYRLHNNMDNVMVVIGGLLSSTPRFHTTKEVICYSFQQKKWFYLPSLPYDPGYEFAVCTYGDNIFLSGGWLKLQGLAEYSPHKNKWKVRATMVNGRCGHAMVAVSHSIFVLGGRDGRAPALTTIEEYNLQTKKWTNAGNLPVGVRSMCATPVGEKILVFGGITHDDTDTKTIQCFDTRLRTITQISDLPFPCRLTRSVVCDSAIYIIAPDGRVIEVDETAMVRTRKSSSDQMQSELSVKPLCRLRGKLSHFSQHHFEAVQHQGMLMLAGGKVPPENIILNSVRTVDPETMVTQATLDMPSPRWCFGCVKTVIRNEYLNSGICF